MKIVIVNGSHRKNGATALILNEIQQQLKKYNVNVQMIHVADLSLNYCVGCGSCYKTGSCIYKDDIENLSRNIANADGVIIGSPTYASNVSGQLKVIIDRGHFVMEQLLCGKYAISVITYENYGGKDSAKILNRLLAYSGAKISGKIVFKNKFNTNPVDDLRLKKYIYKTVQRFYCDISKKHKYICQGITHLFVFRIGIKPFVISKGSQYNGVIKNWEKNRINNPTQKTE